MIKPIQFGSNDLANKSTFAAFEAPKTNVKAPEPTVLTKAQDDKVDISAPKTSDDTEVKEVPKETAKEAPKEVLEGKEEVKQGEDTEKKLTFKDVKKKAFNVVKGFNTATGTTMGAIKGVIFGGLVLGATGIVGKNIKVAKSNIWKTAGGILKDTTKVLGKALGFIPSLITKSPLQNVKDVSSVPKKFYGTYLKGHKATAAIATAIGLGVLGFNVVKGKMKANCKNADVDHATNMGHIK